MKIQKIIDIIIAIYGEYGRNLTEEGMTVMKLNIGDVLYGFEVTGARENKKLGGTLYEMLHRKTGAQLCFADNGNENKLFSVAFKTIPEDSTGVFHILEHSVLCGSKKYPVKDPFVELLKSSMNTFLNAMTYPDKTVYPVSSRNEQDYLNLTSIYLDAVFAPKLLENPLIFRQEGWRFEKDEEGDFCYNGVVFSEMKGAMSEVNSVIEEEAMSMLFKDSCYRHNSGGDPAHITDLTYEKFAQTYRRFYHPSNARFFLDGSVPLEKTLEMIEEYLENYERKEVKTEIVHQQPHCAEKTVFFESDGVTENRDNICFSKLLGTYDNVLEITAAKVLCGYLSATNDSPLKKAIISSSLGENLEVSVSDGIYQPYISVTVRNCNADNIDEIRRIIKETVSSVEIPDSEITASLNKREFLYRQTPEPQGLEHTIAALDSWLYDGDPMMFFCLDEVYAQLRALIGTDFYKKLLEKIFSDDGVCTLILKPDEEFSAKRDEEERKKIASIIESLSEEELHEKENEMEAVFNWQSTPDSEEDIAKLPTLDISCLDKEPRDFVTQAGKQGEVTVLRHPVETNGIAYFTLYFPITEFSFDEYSALALLTYMLGEMPTEKYSVTELRREINTYIGSLSFDVSVFGKEEDKEHCLPCLTVSIGVLKENISKAAELIAELLFKSDFSDNEKIKNLILQLAQYNREDLVASGHAIGATAVRASYTAKNAFKEAVGGISSIIYVNKLAEEGDKGCKKIAALYEKVREYIGTENMILSLTTKDETDINEVINVFPKGRRGAESATLSSPLPENIAIKIPAAVSYAVKGWHPSLSGQHRDGSLAVCGNIVSLAYLWDEVRVHGGAYGAGMSGGANDGIFCYSYRDPSPARSVEVYDRAADFLEAFAKSGEDISGFIISTVASANPLLTPMREGAAADNLWLCGIDYEERKERYRKTLSTSGEDLLRWAGVLRDMAQNGAVCVVGGEELIASCEGLKVIEVK